MKQRYKIKLAVDYLRQNKLKKYDVVYSDYIMFSAYRHCRDVCG